MPGNADMPQGLTEREAEIYELTVVNKLTQSAIAERLGISQPRVSQILSEARAKLPPVDLAAIRAEAVALYDRVQREALKLAEMEGAPVTSGKDGDIVRDPEGGAVVRDYGGRVKALQLALQAAEDRRKLLGADAATKQEVSSTVKYEIVGGAGIDPALLT